MPSTSKSARSRFSSPLHLSSSPASHNKGVATEGQRKFLQRWLEPPLQNKPSFQEAGLMRAGVVENMAPLGTLPKAAKRQSAVGTNADGTPAPTVKRIVVKKPAAVATTARDASVKAEEAEEEEEEEEEERSTTPPPAAARPGSSGTESASPTRPVYPVNGMDDEEDEDYTPVPKKSGRSRRPSISAPSNSRPVRSGRRSTATRQKSTSPPPAQSSASSIAPQEPEPAALPEFHAPASCRREPENKELADRAVESAVDEALSHYRYPTAWALRLLYDENCTNPHFVSMIEDVFHQRADVDTLEEFTRLVNARKKEGKADDKGCYYFVPPATGTHFTPHKPQPAPYGALLTMDMTPAKNRRDDPDQHVSKKQKLEDRHYDYESGTPTPTASGANGAGNMNGLKAHKSPHKSPHKSSSHQKSPHKSPHKSPGKGRRRRRSRSVSSDSSLSSVPDDALDDYDEFMDHVDESLGVSRPSTAEPNNAPTPVASFQPINSRRQKPASKKKNATPKPGPSPNTPTHPAPSQDPDMPGAVAVNGASHHNNSTQQSSKDAAKHAEFHDPQGLIQRKLRAKQETRRITEETRVGESFTRDPLLSSDPFDYDLPAATPVERPRSSRTPAPTLSLRAVRAAKRNHEYVDESVSPTTTSLRADAELPSSTRSSRAATPSNLRLTKKQRTGLRVKTSPMKKKGTSAGIPRGSGDRPSPVFNGAPHDKDDNDDSCYTCGGSGELVCCDGCHYSFHFMCIDPPMDEKQQPDDYFCNECQHRFFPAQFAGHHGAFGTLLDAIDRKNPRAFRLPVDIRERFEGVKTGADGEYEEVAIPKPKPKKGVEEPIDFFKLKNADGNPVICFKCHEGMASNRPIIPCSLCGLHWHLECVEPPMAVPPVLRHWRCPCHAEEALEPDMASAHKHRKVKRAPVIEQAFTRGLRNNGWIEVEEDDEPEDTGRVYRVSEKGIKLDFVSRVYDERRAARARASAAKSAQRDPALSMGPGERRSIEEQQASLNLSQLAGSDNGADLLIRSLVAHAPPSALALMAQGDATRLASGNLSQYDVNSLQAMLAQADALRDSVARMLETSRPPAPTQEASIHGDGAGTKAEEPAMEVD